MDGIHDLGGRQGFGMIDYNITLPIYDEPWEAKIHALSTLLRRLNVYNIDEYRHAIERMEPAHYLGASYYERVLTSCITLCIEKGLFTKEALEASIDRSIPVAGPGGSGRLGKSVVETYEPGDAVQTLNEFVSGHYRLPAYARNKRGVVEALGPMTPFPDAVGHGLPGKKEQTYFVRFETEELWPESSDKAAVYMEVFASYLAKAHN